MTLNNTSSLRIILFEEGSADTYEFMATALTSGEGFMHDGPARMLCN
jgi:hypothetical protein